MYRSLSHFLQSSKHRHSRYPQLVRYFASDSKPYDVVVIGGGPGGYVCAIKAAQLGLRTACVENRGFLGGTCLNVGCIPSKALLNASHMFHDAHSNFTKYGIDVNNPNDNVTLNIKNLMAYKTRAVTGLTRGVESLFKKNKVDYIKGKGTIQSNDTVRVEKIDGSGTQEIQTKNIVIATGSVPASLPGVEMDEKTVVSSTGALELQEVPKHLVVIGAGVIGLEMGSVWSRFGSKLTVVEFGDRITPGIDTEVATAFKKILEKQHFTFKLGSKVTQVNKGDNGQLTLKVEGVKSGKTEEVECDAVLVATGRRPYTQGLGIGEEDGGGGVKLKMEGPGGSQVWIDDHFRTSEKGIYAIGDVVRGPMLAHKAEEEGIAVAEIIAGKPGHVNYNAIPGVIYTHPEVAVVGATEDECKKQNISYEVRKFPMLANSRARTNDDADGFVKIIIDKETDRILGAHILAPNAGENIAELVLGIEYGASAEDIYRTCHAHPTLSEAIKEACMPKAIHF